MANSKDPDDMSQNAEFLQGMHCLLRQNLYSDKEIQCFMEFITLTLNIYTIDYPDLTVSNFMEKSIDLQKVNTYHYSTIKVTTIMINTSINVS